MTELLKAFKAALAPYGDAKCRDCLGRGWIKRLPRHFGVMKAAKANGVVMACGCTRRHSTRWRRDERGRELAPSAFDQMVEGYIARQREATAESRKE